MGFFSTRLIAKLLLNKQYLKILVLSDGLFVDYPAFLNKSLYFARIVL